MEEAAVQRHDDGREVFRVPVSDPFASVWVRLTYACLLLNAVVQVIVWGNAFRWVLLVALVLTIGLGLVVAYRVRRDPPRLIVDKDGVAVVGGWTRRRWAPWTEIEDFRIDPPGGTRTVRVLRRGRRWESFQAVRDDDVSKLQQWWSTIISARRALPPGSGRG